MARFRFIVVALVPALLLAESLFPVLVCTHQHGGELHTQEATSRGGPCEHSSCDDPAHPANPPTAPDEECLICRAAMRPAVLSWQPTVLPLSDITAAVEIVLPEPVSRRCTNSQRRGAPPSLI